MKNHLIPYTENILMFKIASIISNEVSKEINRSMFSNRYAQDDSSAWDAFLDTLRQRSPLLALNYILRYFVPSEYIRGRQISDTVYNNIFKVLNKFGIEDPFPERGIPHPTKGVPRTGDESDDKWQHHKNIDDRFNHYYLGPTVGKDTLPPPPPKQKGGASHRRIPDSTLKKQSGDKGKFTKLSALSLGGGNIFDDITSSPSSPTYKTFFQNISRDQALQNQQWGGSTPLKEHSAFLDPYGQMGTDEGPLIEWRPTGDFHTAALAKRRAVMHSNLEQQRVARNFAYVAVNSAVVPLSQGIITEQVAIATMENLIMKLKSVSFDINDFNTKLYNFKRDAIIEAMNYGLGNTRFMNYIYNISSYDYRGSHDTLDTSPSDFSQRYFDERGNILGA